MIGVDVDNIDSLIKKCNNNPMEDDIANLVRVINELPECYKGSDLDFLFNKPLDEQKNLYLISKIAHKYVDVLSSVRTGYYEQSLNLQHQLQNISSKM